MALDYVVLTTQRRGRTVVTPPTEEQKLLCAVKFGQLQAVEKLVENGVDVNSKGDNNWTPLTLACRLGRLDIVKYLLHECDSEGDASDSEDSRSLCGIDFCNDCGDTPLICAAREGHNSVVKLLLETGACPNLPNMFSSITPLLAAIDGGHAETVGSLLHYDVDVQLSDNVKLTPLYTAIKLDNRDVRENITRQLIHAGCDVNIGSQDHAPIFLASRRGYLSVVKMLCEANCDINIVNKYGVTPVYEAVIKGHNDVLRYLVSQGCDVNKQDMYGIGPLHAAAIFNNPQAVKLLIQAGACVKQRDQNGRCAVHSAIEQGFAEIVEIFLCHGVDLTQPPTSLLRLPSLNKAFEHGHADVIRVLFRGCTSLPIHQCRAARLFRWDIASVRLLILSGMKLLPNSFLSSDLFDDKILTWIEQFRKTPPSLQTLCRFKIRQSLHNKVLHSAPLLPLPTKLIDFISLSNV